MTAASPPPRHEIDEIVTRALAEDLGTAGDVTSAATVPADAEASGEVVAREDGVIAGLPLVAATYAQVDGGVAVELLARDGDRVAAGARLARIHGPARSVLAGERTALNLLGHLSGIATATSRFVSAVAGTRARIVDTRKTTPGLRALDKYAVRCGGGVNHRFGLHDAVLIKDNHVAVAGGVTAAVKAARATAGHLVKVEVEVDTLEQLDEALAAGADIVLLDNMDLASLAEAVRRASGRALTEASGGVTLDTVAGIAGTGVDLISVGAITHSAPSLDVALDFRS